MPNLILPPPAGSNSDFLQEALLLRSWGFGVFPLRHDKTPRVLWGELQDRRSTDRELSKMFALSDVGGLAVLGGHVSGHDGASLAIRDFDAECEYEQWAGRNPGLAGDAPTVLSRRGRHVYCFVRGHVKSQDLPNGELIGHKKYVAAPPSIHPTGLVYSWAAGPPLGIRDFPVLSSLSDTGFLTPTQEEKKKKKEKGKKDKYCLCPVTPLPEPEELPLLLREAVLRNLPMRAGERHNKLFQLARALRDLLPLDVGAATLVHVVRSWWWKASPVIGTKEWEATWASFRLAWSRAVVPISASVPIQAITAAAVVEGDSRERLKAACRELAGLNAGGTFHLSARTAGRAIGLGKTQAAYLLDALVKVGFVELVKPGTQGAKARRASVYRLGVGIRPPHVAVGQQQQQDRGAA